MNEKTQLEKQTYESPTFEIVELVADEIISLGFGVLHHLAAKQKSEAIF